MNITEKIDRYLGEKKSPKKGTPEHKQYKIAVDSDGPLPGKITYKGKQGGKIMNITEKINKYLGESKKGEGEFKKMKKIVNNVFTNNKKFDFEVKEYPSIGSFTIKGDIKTILQVLESTIGNSQKLFADYGYSITKYPSQNTVLLKNFDLFIDNKWKSIWKS